MSTIQNLKNFIRHGKQARIATPHAEPTTDISAVHAEHQRHPQAQYQPAAGGLGSIDTRSKTAQPGNVAAAKQDVVSPKTRRHEQEIEQIIAEEKLSRSTMPKYPGLERWILLEKMGDGAFSNVYRARDSTGKEGEVAIKVVRKYEMNSKQVRAFHLFNIWQRWYFFLELSKSYFAWHFCNLPFVLQQPTILGAYRANLIFTRI